KRISGVKLLAESLGEGPAAKRGDRVVFNMKIWLNRGDEVPLNVLQAQHLPEHKLRKVGNEVLVDHAVTLGRREAVAGVENSLIGMKAEGYRKVRVSPHLAYRDAGVPDLIPANAVLLVELWMREITPGSSRPKPV